MEKGQRAMVCRIRLQGMDVRLASGIGVDPETRTCCKKCEGCRAAREYSNASRSMVKNK